VSKNIDFYRRFHIVGTVSPLPLLYIQFASCRYVTAMHELARSSVEALQEFASHETVKPNNGGVCFRCAVVELLRNFSVDIDQLFCRLRLSGMRRITSENAIRLWRAPIVLIVLQRQSLRRYISACLHR